MSTTMVFGMPYGMIQLSESTMATCENAVFVTGTLCVNLALRYVTRETNWLQHFVFVSGPTMTITTNAKVTFVGNNCNYHW